MSVDIGLAPFPLLSISELLALEVPEFDWAVEGLLPVGSFTMLVAREKAGKSLLATDLCCSVALGEPFLGRAVKQGPAILVAAEENIRDVRERIILRLDGRTDADLYVLAVNGFTEDVLNIDQWESLSRLNETILLRQPVVVVLDPMRELHNKRENDSDDMGPMLRPIRQLAHATNTALVMNHHMSRMGTSRGSTAIRASVDQELAFRRTDDELAWEHAPTEGVLRVEGRFGPRQMIGVRLGPKCRWETASVTFPGETSNVRGRIIALLQQSVEGLTAEEMATELGASKGSIQNALSQMTREHTPKIVSRGMGSKLDPRRFCAVDPFLFDEPSQGSQESREGDEPFTFTTPLNNEVVKGSQGSQQSYERYEPPTTNGKYPPGIYVCAGCDQLRPMDETPCRHCGETKGRTT